MRDKLKRIGVFYDGNYFFRVSSYYAYGHERKSRLSISGLHDFIMQQVAQEENADRKLCQIVDAHYFRGRLSASEASQRGETLYWDRVFDDILMSEGVITHYLPVKTIEGGNKQEKGIDVLLAVEALEMTFYKKFDVVVLVASDGDYVPLVRKLNTLGTRVMVLSWDFEYTDDTGRKFTTRTSQDLLEEVSYPIAMHEIINNRLKKNEPMVNNMFVQSEFRRPQRVFVEPVVTVVEQPEYEIPYVEPSVQNVLTNPQPPQNNPAINTHNQPVINQIPANPQPNPIINPTQQPNPVQQPAQTVQPVVEQQPIIQLPADYQRTADVSPIIQPFINSTGLQRGEILSLKNGFGFIKFPPNNLFFHYTDVKGIDFNDLQPGDLVEFNTGVKENGQGYATNIKLID